MEDVDAEMVVPGQGEDGQQMGSPSASSVMSGSDGSESAGRTLTVPHDRIVSIEHPCIIRDIDRAVKVLGGEHHIKKIVHEKALATTSLRPDDPFAKKLVSHKAEVDHVLLRIVLPRRTGRKRKRGTDEPYEFHDDRADQQNDSSNGHASHVQITQNGSNGYDRGLPLKADEILKKLSAAEGQYSVEPLGTINTSHRFRSLPDFQHMSQDSPLFRSVANCLLPLKLEEVKKFTPDMSVSANPQYIPGPPRFAPYAQPLSYGYGQNRATVTTVDETGRLKSNNISIPSKRHQPAIRFEDPAPLTHPSSLPVLNTCHKPLQDAVSALTTLLSTRQVTTRRAAMNLCSSLSDQSFKDASQYAGYAFKSGPWKDCHVLYGVDPRTDPAFKDRQILGFQIEGKGKKAASGLYKRPEFRATGRDEGADHEGIKGRREEGKDHIFDGRGLGVNKTFQIMDITAPVIREMFDNAEVMEKCDEHDGWWGNGIMATARVLMRDMIAVIQGGNDPEEWREAYEVAAKRVPGVVTEENVEGIALEAAKCEAEGMDKEQVKKAVDLVTSARTLIRQGVKGVGKGRRLREPSGRFGMGGRQDSNAASESIVDADEEVNDGDVDAVSVDEEGFVSGEQDGAMEDLEAAEFIGD
ncbi:Tau95 Triple barrel domain-containing protein [Elsinoe fawcettii]|nr:Tau95 Triple barrel domain-containing protein [Elsinoe fawcettii]